LAIRYRLGQLGYLVRVELVADVRPVFVIPALEEAGAQGGADQADEAAQDAILVEAGDVLQQQADDAFDHPDLLGARPRQGGAEIVDQDGLRSLDVGRNQGLHLDREGRAGELQLVRRQRLATRIEFRQEQLHQQAGNRRVAVEGLLHVALRERGAGLQQILRVAAQHRDLAPAQLGAQDQPVEAVVLGVAPPDLLERILEQRTDLFDAESELADRLHVEVLDRQRRVAGNLVDVLGEHAQAEVFQLRQYLGQGDVATGAVDLEAQ